MKQFRNESLNRVTSDLIKDGYITEEQVKLSLEKQDFSKTWLDSLVEDNIITEKILTTYLSKHSIKVTDPNEADLDTAILADIPIEILKQYRFLPLYEVDDKLMIATPDLDNVLAIDYIKKKSNKNIELIFCTKRQLDLFWTTSQKTDAMLNSSKINNYSDQQVKRPKKPIIRTDEDIESSLKQLSSELTDAGLSIESEKSEEEKSDLQDLETQAAEAPIIKMVNIVLMNGISKRASDIHLSPEEHELLIRVRIDGILHDLTKFSKSVESAIISRIKIMCEMDIANRKTPQDGKFKVVYNESFYDIRCSVFPTQYGENMVLRILPRGEDSVRLDKLGFLKPVLKSWKKNLQNTGRVLLVTGPTGSGKTTTLYASINEINQSNINIMTIEDPIEYSFPLIRQSQVNLKTGLTFATGLRAILRQDPDVIMVGEIRDEETARTAIQSALTGHLVFSTLHTNDSVGAVYRLLDMGIESFLISSSVSAVLAIRLARTICKSCKIKVKMDDVTRPQFREENIHNINEYFMGKGCNDCHNTGYKGRIIFSELLEINHEIEKLIAENASEIDIKIAAHQNGMASLRKDGIAKVIAGMTTLEEVLRVTPSDRVSQDDPIPT